MGFLTKIKCAALLGLFFFPIVFTHSLVAKDVVGLTRKQDGGSESGVVESEGKRQQIHERLADKKLEACQVREKAIKNRSARLGRLAGNMEEKFSAIALRVEEYYTAKVVAGGSEVSGYDDMVTEIDSKKEEVRAALAQVDADASGFSCTGEDPKGQITRFKSDTRIAIKTLKDYRTSIKSLIVAVRSAAGAVKRAHPSALPEPTGSLRER